MGVMGMVFVAGFLSGVAAACLYLIGEAVYEAAKIKKRK